jgi:hypothetical protein
VFSFAAAILKAGLIYPNGSGFEGMPKFSITQKNSAAPGCFFRNGTY